MQVVAVMKASVFIKILTVPICILVHIACPLPWHVTICLTINSVHIFLCNFYCPYVNLGLYFCIKLVQKSVEKEIIILIANLSAVLNIPNMLCYNIRSLTKNNIYRQPFLSDRFSA